MMQEEFPYAAALNLLTHLSTDQDSTPRSKPSWKGRVLCLEDVPSDKPWRGVSASLATVGLITIVGFWIEPHIRGANLAILYLLAVVFGALRWGRRAVTISAISSALLFDYFFVLPYRSFAVGDLWYLITLIGLLAVGLIISTLMVAAREEAQAARRREAHATALYSFTKSLVAESGLDQTLDAIERHVLQTFQRPIIVLLPDAGGLTVRLGISDFNFDERERAAAAWAFDNGQEAGHGTGEFSGSEIRYLPLKTWQGVVGVAGIQVDGWKAWLSGDRQQLLGTFMNQAALAITRADLLKKAQRAEALQEAEKLQKALLNSVSHNLRTPLASVIGALNSVLEDGPLLDTPTQQSLLKTAQEEARKLNWLFQNLLDMTRLEGAAIRVKAEPCDVHDVVGAALHQLGEAVRSHPVSVTIAPNLPLVPMDHALIVQVLVNLLDNALKYSSEEAPIEIEAGVDAGQLEIRVLDSGWGIPEQDLDRVFEKFFRGALPGAPRGTGLGLPISKGFVEAHHGRIFAARRAQGGTEVAFFLPVEATL